MLRNEDVTLRTHERNWILFFETHDTRALNSKSWADFHMALKPLKNFIRTNQAAGASLVLSVCALFVPEQDGSESGTYRIGPGTCFSEFPI